MSANITMHELYERNANLGQNEIILDVRTAEEYREGHIHGSINIDHGSIASHASELKKYDKVYIHCKMGGRAAKAFESLLSAGLTNLVCVSDGGMQAWIEAGYPVEK